MSDRELILRDKIASDESSEGIAAAVELCTEFLFAKEAFEEAELILLEKIGLQSLQEGFVLELTLGDLYIRMKEDSRASRFLSVASNSSDGAIKQKANELLEKLKQTPPEL
jgi:hypothetical protein